MKSILACPSLGVTLLPSWAVLVSWGPFLLVVLLWLFLLFLFSLWPFLCFVELLFSVCLGLLLCCWRWHRRGRSQAAKTNIFFVTKCLASLRIFSWIKRLNLFLGCFGLETNCVFHSPVGCVRTQRSDCVRCPLCSRPKPNSADLELTRLFLMTPKQTSL